MLVDKTFGSLVNPARIGAASHSLGGYTVLADAGGSSNPERCKCSAARPLPTPHANRRRPLPSCAGRPLARMGVDPDFRQRYSEAGKSYRDERIRVAFAMAPGPGPIFARDSFEKISLPVAIVAGRADEIIPTAAAAEAFASRSSQWFLGFDTEPFEDRQVFGWQENLDASGNAFLTANETVSFEGDDHLVD
ncbi:hypothetical protein AS156_15395 [Bradyrhizobium macuxiense]|uniref:Uncharacterized protein n=1 Tax=Bradyrhizobium macuxiense TaxID=1755647 RepID=A0A109JJC0_9BRAD|nr:hypothetical protein AS156_15395 [Bradyrhizobium macuxiense]